MKPISIADANFLAALFEGEGSFSGTIDSKDTVAINVCVSNTNREMLEWCQTVTGIGTVHFEQHGRKTCWKPQFQWVLSREEIREFVPLLLPFLKWKRIQAELILELMGTLNKIGVNGLTMEQRVLRAVICSELADLNRKGRPVD